MSKVTCKKEINKSIFPNPGTNVFGDFAISPHGGYGLNWCTVRSEPKSTVNPNSKAVLINRPH